MTGMAVAWWALLCLVSMVCAMALYIVIRYWHERRSMAYSVLMTSSYIGALITLTVSTSTLEHRGVLIAAITVAALGLVGIVSLFEAFVAKSLSRQRPTPPPAPPQAKGGSPPVRLVPKRERPARVANNRHLGQARAV